MTGPAAKVLTYSHDGYGLGHLRRTLALLSELTRLAPGADVLTATGSPVALRLSWPAGVDFLKLPTLTKDAAGTYEAESLALPVADLIELRSALLEAAAGAYAPDLVLVDFYPLGVHEELTGALRRLRRRHGVRLVLGLRDVLDDPASVRAQWRDRGHLDAITELYDQVLVYGDRTVYDPVAEYGWGEDIARKLTFTGYLVPPRPEPGPSPRPAGDRRLAVCTGGGGKDAAPMAWAFLEAVDQELPDGWDGLLVTGPLMDPAEARRLGRAAAGTAVTVVDFHPDVAGALAAADVVVSMGGYNTMCDVLALGTPTVVVPRVWPRSEQLIRAQAFAARGVVRLLHPAELGAAALGAAMCHEAARSRAELRSAVDSGFAVGGLQTAARRLAAMLAAAPRTNAAALR